MNYNNELRNLYDWWYEEEIIADSSAYEVKSLIGPFLAIFEAIRAVNMSSLQFIASYSTPWRDDIMKLVLDQLKSFNKISTGNNDNIEQIHGVIRSNCRVFLEGVYNELEKLLPKYINRAVRYINYDQVPDINENPYYVAALGHPEWWDNTQLINNHPLLGVEIKDNGSYHSAWWVDYMFDTQTFNSMSGLEYGDLYDIASEEFFEFYKKLKKYIAYVADEKGGFINNQTNQQPINVVQPTQQPINVATMNPYFLNRMMNGGFNNWNQMLFNQQDAPVYQPMSQTEQPQTSNINWKLHGPNCSCTRCAPVPVM